MSAEVDWQALFNIATGGIGLLFGWVLRVIWGAQERVTDDLKELQRQLPNTYVRRDDFRDHADRIERSLRRIEEKIDEKVDR